MPRSDPRRRARMRADDRQRPGRLLQVVSSVKAEYPPVGNYHFNAYLSLIEKAGEQLVSSLSAAVTVRTVSDVLSVAVELGSRTR